MKGKRGMRLPRGWTETILGEVIELKYGKSMPAKQRDNGEYPVFGSNGQVGRHSAALTSGPTLIVGRKGSIGEVHLSAERCWPIDTAYYVDDFYGQPPEFWYHLLRSLKLTELNRATTLPGLNRNDAYVLSVKLPPLNEQKRIVSRIEALQARSRRAREALEIIPDLVEQLRQSILAAAFRGDLTKEWREKHPNLEPASELLKRIRAERRKRWEEAELYKLKAKGLTGDKLDEEFAERRKQYKESAPVDTSDLPELPEGWCWTSLSQLSSAVRTIAYGVLQPGDQVNGGVKLVRICDIENGNILAEQLRTVSAAIASQYVRTRLEGGELLISVVGTIGRLAIASHDLAGANIARAIARVVPVGLFEVDWLMAMLSSPFLQDWLVRGAREVARKTLNVNVLEKAPIPLAPIVEMREILRRATRELSYGSPIMQTISRVGRFLATLDQSILSKAFRGELVPQDLNDEPASVLLERIRQPL